MKTVSYLISVTTSQNDVEVTLAILNIAGMGQAFYGQSDSMVSTVLWIIPKGKNSQQEVLAQLRAIPAMRSVSVVALSEPVRQTELAAVRAVFTGVGWDAGSVSDDDLSLFIDAKLQGKCTYYIDDGFRQKGEVPAKICIRPAEDHPHFSPNWLNEGDHTEDEVKDREITLDDLKIHTVVHRIAVEQPPVPPPPKS